MVLKFSLIGTLIFLLSCGSNENDHSSYLKQNAKDLYIENCAACHGGDGKLCVSGANDLTISTLSAKMVRDRIEKGKNGMPPMKNRLESKENISAVTEYVIRMRKDYGTGTRNRR